MLFDDAAVTDDNLVQPCCCAKYVFHAHVPESGVQGLREILSDEDIPKEWGGKREKGIYMDSNEVDLFKLVAKNNGCKLEDLAIEGMFDPSQVKEKQ
jgi:hypothetical protein